MLYCVTFGVRNGNAVADSRRALTFTCENRVFVNRAVGDASVLILQVDEKIDGLVFVRNSSSEADAVLLK